MLAAQLIAVIVAFVAGLSPRLWALVTLALAVTAAASQRLCDRQSPCRAEVAPYATVVPHRAGWWHPGEGDVMAGSGHSRSLPMEKLNDR
jgi:hypothetical protein